MTGLPTELLWRCDQSKAEADEVINEMVREMRVDLADGKDTTFLWWTMFNACSMVPCADVAAGLATALMRLAQLPEEA